MNLRLTTEPAVVYIVNRLVTLMRPARLASCLRESRLGSRGPYSCPSLAPALWGMLWQVAMAGLGLSRRCVATFNEEPSAFQFTTADVERPGPRIKHNMSVLDFARAQLLATQAGERRARSYENLVVAHGASLYLKLAERRGSRVAFNKGSGGMPLNGAYSRAVKMEATGPIANDDMNRAVRFEPKSPQGTARVDFK